MLIFEHFPRNRHSVREIVDVCGCMYKLYRHAKRTSMTAYLMMVIILICFSDSKQNRTKKYLNLKWTAKTFKQHIESKKKKQKKKSKVIQKPT